MAKIFLYSYSLLLFLYLTSISISTQKELKFPFYILPSSKSTSLSTPSNFHSFAQTSSVPVVPNEEETMCLELCFGTPKSCHLLAIHGQSFFMWVQDTKNPDKEVSNSQKFDPNKSTTAEANRTKIRLDYGEENRVIGYTIWDRIYMNDKLLMRGLFMSALDSESFHGDEGMIGLGYRGSLYEERISFINQLYFHGLIFHRVFTQNFIQGDLGELTFGEIPKDIVDDYENYGRCPALNKIIDGKLVKNRKWECQVTGLYFGDEYNETLVQKYQNTRASFFSFRTRALITKEVFDYYEKTYFKEYIEDGKCKRAKDGKYDVFQCEKNMLDVPKVNIVFGDWVMSIPSDKLFVYNKKTEYYEFMFYHKEDFEHWSLGRPVVRNFHMVYDYQNQEIGFYSQKNVIYINDKSEPSPPKIYEKLPDSGEPIDDNENNDPNKVINNEDNANRRKRRQGNSNEMIETIKKESGITEKTKPKSFSTAFIIQTAFYIFLLIIAVFFICFCIFIYIRHKRKAQYLSSDYFLKKANELSTQI